MEVHLKTIWENRGKIIFPSSVIKFLLAEQPPSNRRDSNARLLEYYISLQYIIFQKWGTRFQDSLYEAWLASIFFLNLSKNTGLRNAIKFKYREKERKQNNSRGWLSFRTNQGSSSSSSLLSYNLKVSPSPGVPGADDAVMRWEEDRATGVTPASPLPLRLAFSRWVG